MRKIQTRLPKILHRCKSKTVGVLGDFMLDELMDGRATRISPEAPVPIVLMDPHPKRDLFPGGAGNVAANIRALGGRPIPFGAIGRDETGKQLCDELQARGIHCGTLVREPGRTTPRKLRITAHQQHVLRLDFEKNVPVPSEISAALARSFARWVSKLNALIITDYQKGSVRPELCNQVSTIARQRRIPVFVDAKPELPEICRHATAVTYTLREAELVAGRTMRDRASLEAAGRQLLAMLDCSYFLITEGTEGMTLFEKNGSVHKISGVARPVCDVTGASDTVIAVLALAVCSGADMKEAASLANLAAGQVVMKSGTSEVSQVELLKAVTGSLQEA